MYVNYSVIFLRQVKCKKCTFKGQRTSLFVTGENNRIISVNMVNSTMSPRFVNMDITYVCTDYIFRDRYVFISN